MPTGAWSEHLLAASQHACQMYCQAQAMLPEMNTRQATITLANNNINDQVSAYAHLKQLIVALMQQMSEAIYLAAQEWWQASATMIKQGTIHELCVLDGDNYPPNCSGCPGGRILDHTERPPIIEHYIPEMAELQTHPQPPE